MIGVFSWIIAALAAYGAISGYNILGQETNTGSIMLEAVVAFCFFIVGLVSFFKPSRSSGSYGYSSSSSSSDSGGFFSFMSFDGGSDSGSSCDSGGGGDCGGGGGD